jgi:hypothetical protein
MNRKLMKVGIFFCMILNATISKVMAARPFVTDDAGTVSQSTFELETGCDFWKDATTLGACLKHGITERMDIGIGFGYAPLPDDERGFDGAELGLKFGLIPDLFSLSASGCFGNNTYGINAIVSKAFGFLSFDANLGIEATAATNDGDLTYGLCCHYDFERCVVGAEICGTHEELSLWQLGSSFGLFDWVTIDAGINGDFEKDVTLSATAGLTFSFPVPKN